MDTPEPQDTPLPTGGTEPPSAESEARDRALIEQLIAATRLYESAEAVGGLLNFAVRLRAFAPFNAMLLHIQKPGLTHATSAGEWYSRYRRVPIEGRRPLLILRAMGPVDFVFDILDTEGADLPPDAFVFPTLGSLTDQRFNQIVSRVIKDGIEIVQLDVGDASAGWIRRIGAAQTPGGKGRYKLGFNKNHDAPTRLVTIAHELAHLHLGHLGPDKGRDIRDRRDRTTAQREVEAEMVAYLVAKRSGLTPRSETYLASYSEAFGQLDLYGVMRAANAVETVMGVATHQLLKEAKAAAP